MKKIFRNRQDAGLTLGMALYEKYYEDHPIVVGIPRGGVAVAYYVAQLFNTEVTAIISKKLPYPFNQEVAFGAISEDLSVYVKKGTPLSSEVVMKIIEQQMDELERRLLVYRSGKPLPDMEGKLVIIVDDGIATGATIVPVIQLCIKRKASRIVVAAPVSGPKIAPELSELADEVFILEKPKIFSAVSQVYEDFSELNDNQVKEFLNINGPV